MLVRTTTPNRLRWRTMATVTTASSVSSTVLMKTSMAASRSACTVGGSAAATAAVLRQQRPDALMQAGLRQRVRHDRAGEKEQGEEKQKLQRDQAETRLQTHAQDQKADAERVGDAGRVHAGENIGHAHEPERPDDREERPEQDAAPSSQCRGRASRLPLRIGVVGEIAVAEELQHRERADEVEQAVGQADVEELGAAGQEADHREQHDGECADRVAREHAVEHGRPLDGAGDRQRQSDEDGGSGGNEHQAVPSNWLTRRSIPPASRSSAPSRTRAWTVRSLPFTPTVIVPGVRVIEFA